jgi:very-short-patch-repair endonuclease|tara:strand:- start:210 stop:1094 length:885 start_codon:yes stop_codon:yes gene_type:complete
MASISKETYVTRNFQKISNKRWELYVITRVIHLLDDPDIEYVCQQYINPPKNEKYYLADLAFPSLKLYLEIDEGQHGSKDHKTADIKRDAEILEATDWERERIAIFTYHQEKKIDKKLEDLNKEIDQFIKLVKNKKEYLSQQGEKISWNYEEKFKPRRYIEKGEIKVNDNVALLYHRDVLRLFGYKKGHWQPATWEVKGFNEMVWFPKLYPNKDWINTFDDLTGLICMQRKNNTLLPKPTSNGQNLIVFAHQKNLFGQTVYKFNGVYTADLEKSDRTKHYFKRIDVTLNLKKYS